MNEYYKIISPLFSVIKDKTVLEYGCFIGDWWQMFELHSPKKVTAIDPRRHPDIESNIIKYNHFVDFKQIGYESLEKDTEHDVIVCAGVLYKMSSPFHLIEDIVSITFLLILLPPLSFIPRQFLKVNSKNLDVGKVAIVLSHAFTLTL